MALEKRKERRIKVNLPIRIACPGNIKVGGQTQNISRLGAYVEMDRRVPIGADVEIAIEIPVYTNNLSLSGKIKCQGNIFRCDLIREKEAKKYYGIGIFFTSFLQPIDREKLSQYIDFLILNEDKNIKEGVRRWRNKREVTKKAKQVQKRELSQEDFQETATTLLKQILNRLEEISRLLQSQNKIR